MKEYIVVNATPIRFTIDGIDRPYKSGERFFAPFTKQIQRALALFQIMEYKPRVRR